MLLSGDRKEDFLVPLHLHGCDDFGCRRLTFVHAVFGEEGGTPSLTLSRPPDLDSTVEKSQSVRILS